MHVSFSRGRVRVPGGIDPGAHLIGSALQTMSFALSFVVARGGPRRGMGGGPVHHAGLNKLERLAGPSVPSSATPQLAFDLAPCILLHAEQRSCAHLSSSSPLASARGSPYTIETGSSLAIGPTRKHFLLQLWPCSSGISTLAAQSTWKQIGPYTKSLHVPA